MDTTYRHCEVHVSITFLYSVVSYNSLHWHISFRIQPLTALNPHLISLVVWAIAVPDNDTGKNHAMELNVDLSEFVICRRISPLFAMQILYWQLLHCQTILLIFFTYVDSSGMTTWHPVLTELTIPHIAHIALFRILICVYWLPDRRLLPVSWKIALPQRGIPGGCSRHLWVSRWIYPEMLIFVRTGFSGSIQWIRCCCHR